MRCSSFWMHFNRRVDVIVVSEVLDHARPLLGGAEDRGALVDILGRFAPYGEVYWLEIGVGDGNNLAFLLNSLGQDRIYYVWALDPQTTSLSLNATLVSRLVLETGGFEAHNPTIKYDVINLRQSAYYFASDREIDRIIFMLSKRGVVTTTLWTKNCFLYRLHCKIAEEVGGSPTIVTAEWLSDAFEAAGLRRVASRVGRGPIQTVNITRRQKLALFDLAARLLDGSALDDETKVGLIERFISTHSSPIRENSVDCFAHPALTDPA